MINEELQRVKEDRNFLHTIKGTTVNWISHILCRIFRIKYDIEGNIEEMTDEIGRRGRRRKELLDDSKKTRV